MMKLEEGFSVRVEPKMVMTKGVVGLGFEKRETVEEPMTNAVAEGRREMGVPDIVIAEPPDINVCVPMINSEAELAVMVEPAMVMIAGEGTGLRLIVDEPMMTAEAEGARETGVPDTVIGGPPGTSVWVPIMKLDIEFGL